MILLTNTVAQTVAPGASVTFDTTIFHTGTGECHRSGSSAVTMRCRGIYEAFFSANIGGTAAGTVTLAMQTGGETLPETTMDSVTAAPGDLENVSTMTAIRNVCEGYARITVTNTGTAEMTVENPKLYVKRVA